MVPHILEELEFVAEYGVCPVRVEKFRRAGFFVAGAAIVYFILDLLADFSGNGRIGISWFVNSSELNPADASLALLLFSTLFRIQVCRRHRDHHSSLIYQAGTLLAFGSILLTMGFVVGVDQITLMLLLGFGALFSGTMSRSAANAALMFAIVAYYVGLGSVAHAMLDIAPEQSFFGGWTMSGSRSMTIVMVALAILVAGIDRSSLRNALRVRSFGRICGQLVLITLLLPVLNIFFAFIFTYFNAEIAQIPFLLPAVAMPMFLVFAILMAFDRSLRSELVIWRLAQSMKRSYAGLEAAVQERTGSLMRLNEDLTAARGEALSRAKHMKNVLDSMETFIGVLDSDGRLLDVNQSALDVIGAKESDVIGRYFATTPWWDFSSESVERMTSIIRQGAAGKRVKADLLYADKTRAIRAVEFVMTPLYREDGSVEYLVPSGVDVQERKIFEDELIKARIEAEISNQAKSSFLAHMSHELRSPLGVITGFIDLALEEKDEAIKNDHLRTVQRNAGQLLALVDEILDLRKIESGQVSIDIEDINLKQLIDDVMKSLKIKADERGLDLSVEIRSRAPIDLRTDPLRLKQILLNILGNAIKYTEHGYVQCEVDSRFSGPGGEELLEFLVKDSGIGIAGPDRAKIFEPFCRGRLGQQKRFSGTGLGLVLSRRLARLLGGDVELVSSEVGVGSVFRVTVAVHRRIDAVLAAMSSIHSEGNHKDSVTGGQLSGLTVLVVDDVSDNRVLISRFLEAEGAHVGTAASGEEALAMCLNDGFQAVLMDLSMPGMSGQETTIELRKRGYGVPILALTAHAMREEKEQALKLGFNEYLTKPVTRELLIAALQRILRGNIVPQISGF